MLRGKKGFTSYRGPIVSWVHGLDILVYKAEEQD